MQFSLKTLLILMTVAGVVLGLVGLLIQAAIHRQAEREAEWNLRNIAVGMHVHGIKYGSFPSPASVDSKGKPLLSWRVHILPFIEQDALYQKFRLDEPWDSPTNKALIPKMPKVYESPGGKPLKPGETCFVVAVGANTAFPRMWKRPGWKFSPGVDDRGRRGLRVMKIIDGTSNTVMVLEVAPERAVIWTKPDDFEFDPTQPVTGLVGHRSGGFNTVGCDGAVHFVPETVDAKTLGLLLRIDDQEVDGWPE